jgi:DNA-binding transcriptional ArsR family regulator
MTLKERIERYMRAHHGWIAKGELLRIASAKTDYTADNTGRRLRELENEGILEVRYVKNHAHYRIKQHVPVEVLIARDIAAFDLQDQ